MPNINNVFDILKGLSLLFFVGMIWSSCLTPPEYPDEPKIAFVSMQKDTVRQGLDSNLITISFEDGDGDIGSDSINNLFLTDSRLFPNGTRVQTFKTPVIPSQGIGNGVSGKIEIIIEPTSSCCRTIPPCQPEAGAPMETAIYTMYLEDRAGNVSNVIELPPLHFICDY
jgi:hypothetical protein